MGLLIVLAVLVAIGLLMTAFVYAIRPHSQREHAHGWLVVVPLVVIFGWVIIQLVMG
jgi:hypothetical protein